MEVLLVEEILWADSDTAEVEEGESSALIHDIEPAALHGFGIELGTDGAPEAGLAVDLRAEAFDVETPEEVEPFDFAWWEPGMIDVNGYGGHS